MEVLNIYLRGETVWELVGFGIDSFDFLYFRFESIVVFFYRSFRMSVID